MAAVIPYRVRQLQERERAILAVAAELLAEQGYRDTSMDDIAARLGLSKGTLYHHFPGKDDLMAALYQERLEGLLAALQSARRDAPGPVSVVHRALGLLMRSHSEILRVLGDGMSSPVTALRDRPAIAALLEEIVGEVSAVVDAGKHQGLFARTIDTRIAVRALYALASYHRYRPLLTTGQVAEQDLVDALAALYLGGLAAPADVGRPPTTEHPAL